MVKLVCWNTAYRRRSWCCLRDMDVDVALVQEACNPPQDVLSAVDTGPREHWDPTTWNSDWWVGRWRHLTDRKTMIVKRSDTVQVEWFKQVAPISCVAKDEIGVSGIGTIAAARVIPPKGERPDVLHQSRVSGNGYPPARLRIRLTRLPRASHGPRPQRS